jgi:hypothetical protein
MVTLHSARLDANARDLFTASMRWADKLWDETAGLLWNAGDAKLTAPHHSIRGSIWYAFGLLMRNDAGDVARAVHAIDTVLAYQFDAPGRPFHGTFFRAPEEPYPSNDAIIWRDYDPNWREFIVTVFALLLIEFTETLPVSLIQKIDVAIGRAVDGALARGLDASYTNIALMHAFMLCFAGKRFNKSIWFDEGERMARQVYRLFNQHTAFAEYNSPTYYGVDLYALALWRTYPELSPLLAQLGSEMEAALWRDVAQFYHADLRNLAGPYDRSYGMNMLDYVSVLGIWIRLVIHPTLAPFPNLAYPFEHEHDLGFVPLIAFLGARIPSDALEHFSAFRGERYIERIISDSPRRIATAWLGHARMIGGEFTSRTPPQSNQLHPATIHWRIDADAKRIGWVRALYLEPIDARARRDCLEIATTSEIAFLVNAPNVHIGQFTRDAWQLPNLGVRLETNAAEFQVQSRENFFEVHYRVAENQAIQCKLFTAQ